jgi:hypothetical protein
MPASNDTSDYNQPAMELTSGQQRKMQQLQNDTRFQSLSPEEQEAAIQELLNNLSFKVLQ